MNLDRTKLRQRPKDANNHLSRDSVRVSPIANGWPWKPPTFAACSTPTGIKNEIMQVAQQRTPPGQG